MARSKYSSARPLEAATAALRVVRRRSVGWWSCLVVAVITPVLRWSPLLCQGGCRRVLECRPSHGKRLPKFATRLPYWADGPDRTTAPGHDHRRRAGRRGGAVD